MMIVRLLGYFNRGTDIPSGHLPVVIRNRIRHGYVCKSPVQEKIAMKRLALAFVLSSLTLGAAACGTTIEQKAATGAVAGAVVGGPVGAAVGGAAGTAVGQAQKPN